MPDPMSKADLDQMHVKEMRRQARRDYPKCRGLFASSANREELEALLTQAKTPDEVLRDFYERQQEGAAPPREPQEPLSEGDHGENVPEDGSHVPVDSGGPDGPEAPSQELKKVMTALQTISPVAAKEIERLVKAEADGNLAPVSKGPEVIAEAPGEIVIGKATLPLFVADPADPNAAYVPTADPHYRWDFWRAVRECGAMTFEQDYGDLIDALLSDERILMVGPPAVGKTSLVAQAAAAAQWPMTRFNGNRDVTVQDFVGNYEAQNGSTVWCDGPLPRAMRNGHILVLDEVDHMPAECSSVLHSVLEPGGRLVITGHGGEVVEPHKNFRIVATANTAGFGDTSGIHANAQVQDAAFLSRFDVVFRVGWMTQEHESELLRAATGVQKKWAEGISKVAADSRRAVDQEDMLFPVTLRQTLAWSRIAGRTGDLATGFALAVLNKLPADDVPALAEIAQRHLGNEIGGSLTGAGTERTERTGESDEA